MTTDRNLLTRRTLLRSGALASGALALGPSFWKRAVASGATPTDGPYGPLGPADANGIRLPAGFRSRLIARGGVPVEGTTYQFPIFPDGQATYATGDGGWILVTNAEVPGGQGGVSAIRFAQDGTILSAYRILEGTSSNCSGGPTPWGTWLSCEETDRGAVWECDPTQPSQGQRRPALGLFKHEAVAVDSVGQRLYLTEDHGDSGFYRFTPDLYPILTSGLLEVAVVGAGGRVTWVAVPNPQPGQSDPLTKDQVPGMTEFKRGEGIWFDSGVVYVATTSDGRIHAYDTATETIEVIYDEKTVTDAPLTDVDNITVSPSGDLFACEDNGLPDGPDVAILTPDLTISRFLRFEGPQHLGPADPVPTEATGPIFNPDGTRFYVTSQRARALGSPIASGAVYEISGPFRTQRPSSGPPAPGARRRTSPREPGQTAGSGQGGSLTGAPLLPGVLGVEVPRRVRIDQLRRQGIPVLLTLDRPATVTAQARARFRPVKLANRRSRLRRSYALGSRRRRFTKRGAHTLVVPVPKRSVDLLRGRSNPVRAVVRVTVNGRSLERTLLLKPPRRTRPAARRR